MATPLEQAGARFWNIPSMLANNIPFIAATTLLNWGIDMVAGPPNEFSQLEWERGAFMQNLKESTVVGIQDWAKFAISSWVNPWREDIVPPPDNGSEGAPAINLAYY